MFYEEKLHQIHFYTEIESDWGCQSFIWGDEREHFEKVTFKRHE